MTPHPINSKMDDVFVALGRVASSWSSLEYLINRGIWELADVEQYTGACITAQIIPPSNKCRAYIALVSLHQPPKKLVEKLNKFAVRVDTKARVRNRYIHDPWIYNETQGWPGRLEVSADKKLVYAGVATHPEELERFRVELSELIQHFQLLHAEVMASLPALPHKRFAQSGGIAPLDSKPSS